MVGVLPVPAVAPHLPRTLREPGLTSGPVQVTSSSLRSRVPELRDGGSRGSLQRGVEVAARDEGAKVGVVGEHLVGHELVEQQDQVGHLVPVVKYGASLSRNSNSSCWNIGGPE